MRPYSQQCTPGDLCIVMEAGGYMNMESMFMAVLARKCDCH